MKMLKALLIVSVILIGMPTNAQSDEVARTDEFNEIDGDGNEVITIREMIAFYKDVKDKNGVPIDPKKMFYGLDANKNSIITINEYIKGFDLDLAYEFVDRWDKEIALEKKKSDLRIKKENQKIKFKKIDANRDLEVSLGEMINYYKGQTSDKTGKPINSKLNFYAYDSNNDGKISSKEFIAEPNWKIGWEKFEKSKKSVSEKVDTTSDTKVKTKTNLLKTEESVEQPSEAYVKKRIALFKIVDVDNNYRITLEELQDYYKGKFNKNGDPINAEYRFVGLDHNEDGFIELAEFATKINWKLTSQKYKGRKSNN